MKRCPNCGTELPDQARFCFECGTAQPDGAPSQSPKGREGIDWTGDLEAAFQRAFLRAFPTFVRTVGKPSAYDDYWEILQTSEFQSAAQHRLTQLARQFDKERHTPFFKESRAQQTLNRTIENLLEFFVVYYCRDLNRVPLSESILSFQEAEWTTVNLFKLIIAYLDPLNESVPIYTDFVTLPSGKLRNASQSFLFPAHDERIFLLADLSIWGNAKSGFALTDTGLYWKSIMQEAEAVYYQDMRVLKLEKDILLIDGLFFDASPQMNLKLWLLLRKLIRMIAQERIG